MTTTHKFPSQTAQFLLFPSCYGVTPLPREQVFPCLLEIVEEMIRFNLAHATAFTLAFAESYLPSDVRELDAYLYFVNKAIHVVNYYVLHARNINLWISLTFNTNKGGSQKAGRKLNVKFLNRSLDMSNFHSAKELQKFRMKTAVKNIFNAFNVGLVLGPAEFSATQVPMGYNTAGSLVALPGPVNHLFAADMSFIEAIHRRVVMKMDQKKGLHVPAIIPLPTLNSALIVAEPLFVPNPAESEIKSGTTVTRPSTSANNSVTIVSTTISKQIPAVTSTTPGKETSALSTTKVIVSSGKTSSSVTTVSSSRVTTAAAASSSSSVKTFSIVTNLASLSSSGKTSSSVTTLAGPSSSENITSSVTTKVISGETSSSVDQEMLVSKEEKEEKTEKNKKKCRQNKSRKKRLNVSSRERRRIRDEKRKTVAEGLVDDLEKATISPIENIPSQSLASSSSPGKATTTTTVAKVSSGKTASDAGAKSGGKVALSEDSLKLWHSLKLSGKLIQDQKKVLEGNKKGNLNQEPCL